MEARTDEEDIDGTASWWVKVEVVVEVVVVELVGEEVVEEGGGKLSFSMSGVEQYSYRAV